MLEETRHALEQVLAIEREAANIVARGHKEARAVLAQAKEEGSSLRQMILDEAHRLAQQMIASAEAEAKEASERHLAEVERTIRKLEEAATQRLDTAIQLTIARLLGLPAERAPDSQSPGSQPQE